MNTQLVFDSFDYVTKLEASGFDARQARGAADALGAALTEAVATKSDLEDAVSELKSEIKDLRSEIKDVEIALRSEMQVGFEQVEVGFAQMDAKIAQVDAKFAQMDAKIEKAMSDQVLTIVTLIGSSLLILIIHLWK